MESSEGDLSDHNYKTSVQVCSTPIDVDNVFSKVTFRKRNKKSSRIDDLSIIEEVKEDKDPDDTNLSQLGVIPEEELISPLKRKKVKNAYKKTTEYNTPISNDLKHYIDNESKTSQEQPLRQMKKKSKNKSKLKCSTLSEANILESSLELTDGQNTSGTPHKKSKKPSFIGDVENDSKGLATDLDDIKNQTHHEHETIRDQIEDQQIKKKKRNKLKKKSSSQNETIDTGIKTELDTPETSFSEQKSPKRKSVHFDENEIVFHDSKKKHIKSPEPEIEEHHNELSTKKQQIKHPKDQNKNCKEDSDGIHSLEFPFTSEAKQHKKKKPVIENKSDSLNEFPKSKIKKNHKHKCNQDGQSHSETEDINEGCNTTDELAIDSEYNLGSPRKKLKVSNSLFCMNGHRGSIEAANNKPRVSTESFSDEDLPFHKKTPNKKIKTTVNSFEFPPNTECITTELTKIISPLYKKTVKENMHSDVLALGQTPHTNNTLLKPTLSPEKKSFKKVETTITDKNNVSNKKHSKTNKLKKNKNDIDVIRTQLLNRCLGTFENSKGVSTSYLNSDKLSNKKGQKNEKKKIIDHKIPDKGFEGDISSQLDPIKSLGIKLKSKKKKKKKKIDDIERIRQKLISRALKNALHATEPQISKINCSSSKSSITANPSSDVLVHINKVRKPSSSKQDVQRTPLPTIDQSLGIKPSKKGKLLSEFQKIQPTSKENNHVKKDKNERLAIPIDSAILENLNTDNLTSENVISLGKNTQSIQETGLLIKKRKKHKTQKNDMETSHDIKKEKKHSHDEKPDEEYVSSILENMNSDGLTTNEKLTSLGENSNNMHIKKRKKHKSLENYIEEPILYMKKEKKAKKRHLVEEEMFTTDSANLKNLTTDTVTTSVNEASLGENNQPIDLHKRLSEFKKKKKAKKKHSLENMASKLLAKALAELH